MFRNTRHIHLVAIGGVGMSGIAEVLLNLGFKVSGSDLHATPVTDRLQDLGATVHIGHARTHIDGADVVVRSSAVTEVNCEVAAARARRIPVIRRAEMLAELMRLKHGIAVAGSHGKTTTTTLVAAALGAGGLDPTVIVGGRIRAVGTNAVLGGGEHLVAEADESDGSFLHLTPTIAVVTNIDHEHVDYYPDLDSLRRTFGEFLARVPFYGACVLCLDDPEVRMLVPHVDRQIVTYGLDPTADVRGEPLADAGAGQGARVFARGEPLGEIRIALRGVHNLRNALAAVAVGLELGVDFADIAAGLGASQGVGRRLEEHGEHDGVLVVDDYAHHPTEISATLAAAREYGRTLSVVFQPHRYSRTGRFVREFADALSAAAEVALLPVYPAGEEPDAGCGSDAIADALAVKVSTGVTLLAGPAGLADWLARHARPGGLLLTLGAGDIGRQVGAICDMLDARGQA